jgi:hypothetical protein
MKRIKLLEYSINEMYHGVYDFCNLVFSCHFFFNYVRFDNDLLLYESQACQHQILQCSLQNFNMHGQYSVMKVSTFNFHLTRCLNYPLNYTKFNTVIVLPVYCQCAVIHFPLPFQFNSRHDNKLTYCIVS